MGSENIGTAYVRILADGSALNRSIRDAFDDSNDEWGDAGDRGSKAYWDAWENQSTGSFNQRRVREGIASTLAGGDWANEFLRDNRNWKELRNGLARNFGSAGRLAAKNLEDGLLSGNIDMERLSTITDDLRPLIAKAYAEIDRDREAAYKEHAVRMGKIREDMDREFETRSTDLYEDNLQRREYLDLAFDEHTSRLHAEALKKREDMDREFEQRAANLKEDDLQARLDLDREFEERAAEQHREFVKKGEDADMKFRLEHERALREAAGATDADTAAKRKNRLEIQQSVRDMRALTYEIDRMAQGMSRGDNARSRRALRRDLEGLRVNMDNLGTATYESRMNLHDHERTLLTMHPHLNRFNRHIDTTAHVMGRAFGKGSRNNFINFMGSLASGMIRTASVVPRLTGGLMDVGRRAFAAGRAVGGLRAPVAFLGSIFKDVGKLAGVAAGGIAGLFGVVGPLLSIFSQLAGIVVALAGSIGYALVGSLGALSGAILPVLFGLGGMIGGFMSLEGEAKKAAKGVVKAFKGLGEAAARGLTFDRKAIADEHNHTVSSFEQVMERITGMVEKLDPVMEKVGRGLADAMDIVSQRLTKVGDEGTNAWGKFIKAMKGADDELGWLGVNTRKIGRIFGEAFGGLLGLFRGLMPVTSEFINYLRDAAVRFNEWANSAKGQNSIKDYMEEATESAKEVWGFLGSVSDLFGALLRQGRDTGDSLFGSMSDEIDRWVDTLNKNPDILQNWYDSAEDFAKVLGNVLTGLGKVFAALDNEFSRSATIFVFEAIATAIETVAGALEAVAGWFRVGEDAALGFAGQLAAAMLIIPRLTKMFSGIVAATPAVVGAMNNTTNAMSRTKRSMAILGGAAKGLAGAGGLVALIDGMGRADGAARVLMTTLGGAGVGFAVGGPWGALIGGGLGLALGLFSDGARDANDAAADGKKPLSDYASSFDALTGAVSKATHEMVLNDLQQTGAVSRARGFGISMRDLVRATMGFPDAMARVNEALESGQSYTVSWKNAMGGMETASVRNQRQLEKLTAKILENGGVIDEVYSKGIDDASRDQLLKDIGMVSNAWEEQSRATRRSILATQDLSSLQKKIPKAVYTKVEATGIVPTIAGIAKVVAKYDTLDKKHIKPIIEALGVDATVKDVLRVIAKLEEADRQRPEPTVDANTDPANGKIKTTKALILELVRGLYRPNVDVQTNAAAVSALVGGILSRIPDEEVKVNVVHTTTRRIFQETVATGYGPQPAPNTAMGGVFNYAQNRIIAEAGSEAVVPLNRPLGEVDPAVRWLSAIAQGIMPMGSAGRKVDVGGITVISPSADPHAVAVQTLNRLVAAAY